MNEIYWITRLDYIAGLLCFVTILGVIATIILGAYAYLEEKTSFKKYAIGIGIATFMSIIGSIFLPTTKEMMMILGIGGTIDYIQENDVAKELPDKCVKALDKWVESLNED